MAARETMDEAAELRLIDEQMALLADYEARLKEDTAARYGSIVANFERLRKAASSVPGAAPPFLADPEFASPAPVTRQQQQQGTSSSAACDGTSRNRSVSFATDNSTASWIPANDRSRSINSAAETPTPSAFGRFGPTPSNTPVAWREAQLPKPQVVSAIGQNPVVSGAPTAPSGTQRVPPFPRDSAELRGEATGKPKRTRSPPSEWQPTAPPSSPADTSPAPQRGHRAEVSDDSQQCPMQQQQPPQKPPTQQGSSSTLDLLDAVTPVATGVGSSGGHTPIMDGLAKPLFNGMLDDFGNSPLTLSSERQRPSSGARTPGATPAPAMRRSQRVSKEEELNAGGIVVSDSPAFDFSSTGGVSPGFHAAFGQLRVDEDDVAVAAAASTSSSHARELFGSAEQGSTQAAPTRPSGSLPQQSPAQFVRLARWDAQRPADGIAARGSMLVGSSFGERAGRPALRRRLPWGATANQPGDDDDFLADL